MSASKDKLNRKQQIEAGTDKRTLAQAKEKAKRRKNTITYSVVAVVLVLFFAFVFIYNSAWPDLHTTAVEINGEKYSVAQLDYYYASAYMNFYNTYGNYISYFFDPDTSLAKQDQSEDMTWRQYFLQTAADNMARVQMLCDEAEAAGFTLSDEDQAALDEEMETMRTAWSDLGYSSLDQYLNMNFGKGVDMEMVEQETYRSTLAQAYSRSVYDGFEYSDSELDDYYAEHADELDLIHYAYYTVAAPVEPAEDSSTDAEPAEDSDTDAEPAEDSETDAEPAEDSTAEDSEAGPALDMQAMADAVDGTDLDAFTDYLAENAGEDAAPTEQTLTGNSISSDYSEWLLDSAREAGDATLIETDSASYVVMFLDRNTNDYQMASFRHILINAEDTDGDGTFSEEEISAAADEAQSILDEWEDGDATEDSFAALADERSDDSGSNTNGGLYENVYQGQMVPPIDEWLFEGGRKAGDTTVVSYDGSAMGSYTGTHVVYYVGESDLTYAQYQADTALRNDAYTSWQEEAMTDYEPVTSHLGMAGKIH